MEYNELKDTEAIWIPRIPKHWELIKVRHLFKESTIKGFSDEPLLVASQEHGVVNKDVFGKRTMEATKDFHLLKLVEKGDFVISLRSFQGGIELAHQRGIISPAYTILKEKHLINKRYFKHLFKSKPFISLMTLCVKGIRDGQNIDFPTFKGEYLPVPPIEEQERIGSYLDRKTQQIQEYIAKKERLVELLEEQKKVFTSNILESDNFPKTPLKYLITKIGCGVTPLGGANTYVNEGINFLRSQNVHFNGLHLDDVAFITEKVHAKMKGSQVQKNDVLLNITGASIGRCCVFNLDEEANVNQHVCILRPMTKIKSDFLAFYLSTNTIQNQIFNSQDGASREGLPLGTIKKFQIPNVEKEIQSQLISQVKEKSSELQRVINKARLEIEKAKEYQESLITQVVTGQLKVPEKANANFGQNIELGMVAEPCSAYRSIKSS